MNISTLKRNLKNKFASEILGSGSLEAQLVFYFEFEAKPSKTFNLKATIKKLLAAGIVAFGFVVVVPASATMPVVGVTPVSTLTKEIEQIKAQDAQNAALEHEINAEQDYINSQKGK